MSMYRIVLEGRYGAQQIINEWEWISSEIPSGQSGAFGLCNVLGFVSGNGIDQFEADTLAGALRAAQTGDLQYISVFAANLYSVTDFFSFGYTETIVGQRTGQGMPPFVAAGFTSDRTRLDIRRGQKRFVGVSENDVDQTGYLNAGGVGIWGDVADIMQVPQVVDLGGTAVTYTPYVFSKKIIPATEEDPKKYVKWPTEAEALEHVARINQWVLKPTVRSQVSRQYGHGN